MEARHLGAVRPLAAVCAALLFFLGLVVSADAVHAAGYRTTNFTISAPTPQLAKEIGDTAEGWRKSLALEWLGHELPQWSEPCPITARVSPQLGAGGATSFVFDDGEVFGWRMNIQGSRERVLDSVLPHEITHTIFASHFRQPLPRWADEGACTTVEHRSEIAKQERMLLDFLKSRPGRPLRSIPFDDMFAMTEYPADVLPLYAQGHSLAVFLIGQRGKAAFLDFLADGMTDDNWPRAIREHYGYENILVLQTSWLDWVKAGRPELTPHDADSAIASNDAPQPAAIELAATTTPIFRDPSPGVRQASTVAAAASRTPTTPTPRASAYSDWSTRPPRNSMNVAQGAATAAGNSPRLR